MMMVMIMMLDVIHVDDDDDVVSRMIFVVVMTLLLFSSVAVVPDHYSKIHALALMMTMVVVDSVDDKGVTVLINDNNRTHFVGFVTSRRTRCYYSCGCWCWCFDWPPFVWHAHSFS